MDDYNIDNVKTVEDRFIEVYNCITCEEPAVKKCVSCSELNKIEKVIKELREKMAGWEIAEGIQNACKKLENEHIFSAIVLNYFFYMPNL